MLSDLHNLVDFLLSYEFIAKLILATAGLTIVFGIERILTGKESN